MSLIKKVALVGPLPPPAGPPPAGGMANQTKKLAALLSSEGVDVRIIQTNDFYKPAWVGKIRGIRAVFRLLPYVFNLFVKINNVDIVHIMANSGLSWHLFSAPAILIARLHGVPVVVNYRGGYAETFFNNSWFWVALTLNRAHKITVPSPFLEEIFAKFGKRATVVPNVLDHKLFSMHNDKEFDSQAPHIIVTRNLEKIYDIETAIRAFAQVQKKYPNATLSIAGTGPEKEALVKLVSELNIQGVNFLGRLTPEQMADLYKSAEIMINSSLVDNSPNSIIESLACGTPVVSSNVGGIPKLLTDNLDALLVDSQNEQLMAEKIECLLSDKQLRDSLINQGQKTISKFYWSNVWQTLQDNYQAAIAEAKHTKFNSRNNG